MPVLDGRSLGKCKSCRRKLLLNEEGLCIHCENDAMRETINILELQISRLRREKVNLYHTLCSERMKNMDKEKRT